MNVGPTSLACIAGEWGSGMHEDGRISAIQLCEDGIQGMVSQIYALRIGIDNDSIGAQMVQGIVDFGKTALDIRKW